MGTAAFSVVEQESSAWVVAHRALSRLAKERAAADAEEGRWLLEALRSAAHVHLGFGSFSEYAERCFGHRRRSTQEKLRVAEALEELPVLASALAEGSLHWSAVRELTRVAAPETEHEWLEVAQGKSVRQLEELVAGRGPGDSPTSPSQPSERRHVLRFEVAPETFALFREAMTALRRSSDSALDDDGALLAMARNVLGGPRDEGRASYQIAVTVCAECGRGHQPSGGELVAVGSDIVQMAHCDGQHLGCVTPRAANDSAFEQRRDPDTGAHVGAEVHAGNDPTRVHVGARVRAHVEDRQANAPWGRTSPSLHPSPRRTLARRRMGASASMENASTVAPALARAKQTIPPVLRRAVLARDNRRCRVPSCRSSAFLDVHHLQLRSEGGRNAADNLITLCGAHHRAAHRGRLIIEGSSAAGVRFQHADGSPYGQVENPQALDARAKAFAGLRKLGFREGDVRAVLGKLRDEGELAAASTEQWLRAALERLTPRRSRR